MINNKIVLNTKHTSFVTAAITSQWPHRSGVA